MAQFNTKTHRTAQIRGTSPVTTLGAALNAGGVLGHTRDSHSELFLLAVSLLNLSKDAFHESGNDRTARFRGLVHDLAIADPHWLVRMLGWLRQTSNLRTTSMVGAAEFIAARRGMPDPDGYGPAVVDAVLQRADEPGEMLAYWTSKYGMALPKGLKRGLARAALRLYNQFSLAKYDRRDAAFRFGRVLDLVHPVTTDFVQSALFAYAHADMRGRNPQPPAELGMLRARAELTALPVAERRAVLAAADAVDRLTAAGMTWNAVAGWLHGPLDAAAWTTLIPTMGFEAQLKNLRNFDDAGVDDDVAAQVAARLTDLDEVVRSKQLPLHFYAAYKAVGSLRWAHPLEKALHLSLANVPVLGGRTLVLVDQSPSMFPGFGFSSPQQHEHVSNAELARLFGSAIALRAKEATLVGYGETSYEVSFRPRDALLLTMDKFRQIDGTDTFSAAAMHFRGHDRVVIVTDEQNTARRYSSIDQVVPTSVPVYVWNIGGYKVGSMTSGSSTRHTFAGLHAGGFGTVQMIEAGRSTAWPF